MVEPDKALPGREAEMRVAATHYVLGNPMKGPWMPSAKGEAPPRLLERARRLRFVAPF